MKYIDDFSTFELNEFNRKSIKHGFSTLKNLALSKMSKDPHTIHSHKKKALKHKIKILKEIVRKTKSPDLKKRRMVRLTNLERQYKTMI